jgi:hypothetical protein
MPFCKACLGVSPNEVHNAGVLHILSERNRIKISRSAEMTPSYS